MLRRFSFITLSSLLVGLLPVGAGAADDAIVEPLSFGGAALQMVFALAIVLALLLLLYWLMRRFNPSQIMGGAGGSLKIWGRLSVGPRKNVVLVEAGRKILVLGVGDKEMTLLGQIEDADEIAEIKSKGAVSFKRVMKKAVKSQEREQ